MVTLYLAGTSIRLESKIAVGEHMLNKYRKFYKEMLKEFHICKTRKGCFAYLASHYKGEDIVEQATKLDDKNGTLIEYLETIKTEDEMNLSACIDLLRCYGHNRLADWVYKKLAPMQIQDVEFEQESAPCCENDKKIEQSKLSDEQLKSLQEILNVGRFTSCPNTWKPSDEQITWLYRATDEAKKDSRMKQVLNELLSDLKKLREE